MFFIAVIFNLYRYSCVGFHQTNSTCETALVDTHSASGNLANKMLATTCVYFYSVFTIDLHQLISYRDVSNQKTDLKKGRVAII
jgi:hypothetical protein